MRPDHKMEPLMGRDVVAKAESCLITSRTSHHTSFSSSFSSPFLVLNSRVNKQPARPKCFRPKTESKLLRENIWPLWFCNMFQNTEFNEEHCEKLPSIGMMVGNVTVSEVSIGPFPAGP